MHLDVVRHRPLNTVNHAMTGSRRDLSIYDPPQPNCLLSGEPPAHPTHHLRDFFKQEPGIHQFVIYFAMGPLDTLALNRPMQPRN